MFSVVRKEEVKVVRASIDVEFTIVDGQVQNGDKSYTVEDFYNMMIAKEEMERTPSPDEDDDEVGSIQDLSENIE